MKFIKILNLFVLLLVTPLFQSAVFAQFDVGGDFRIRWYDDQFSQTLDNRGNANYTRLFARINTTYQASEFVHLNVELMNLADTSTSPARGISGTGPIHFVVSQVYGEIVKPDFLGLDLMRLRAGRQQFSIGNGLSFGESYYYYDKFDGGRLDLQYDPFTVTLFGAIYGQDVSTNGLWPEEGLDQIYVGKFGAKVFDQDLMVYGIMNKPRGDYNDSYIIGGGSSGSFLSDKLEYSIEGAYQKFDQPAGAPVKEGIGYMGSLGYSFQFGPFRMIKIETKYAAMQGDDPKTSKIEQFSPPFPDFEFGEREGFVNSEIGGDYPHKDKYPEGSRIWYSRIYFVPEIMRNIRLQFQYTKIDPYVNRLDGYNEYSNEFEVKLYYTFNKTTQFQFRYAKVIPNGVDADLNGNGVISSLEDRYYMDRYMLEFRLKF